MGKRRVWVLMLVFAGLLALSVYAAMTALPRKVWNPRKEELGQVVTGQGGFSQADYVDEEGRILKPANLQYASVTRMREGNVVTVFYLDAKGEKVRLSGGYYGLRQELDDEDRVVFQTYLNKQGEPTRHSSGYTSLQLVYNAEGKKVLELYLDREGQPVASTSGIYGKWYGYTEGENTLIIHLDDQGRPVADSTGAAVQHLVQGPEGVAQITYYTSEGAPTAVAIGQYGVRYAYDALGRRAVTTLLDAEGQPMKGRFGYAILERTFFPDDSVASERYFDEAGEPVLAGGKYGWTTVNTRRLPLNAQGRVQYDLNSFLRTYPLTVFLFALLLAVLFLKLAPLACRLLLAAYLGFILYMTVLRPAGTARLELDLFWSYVQFLRSASLRLEILNNLWLFLPLGAGLYRLHPRWRFLLAAVALSALIELTQFLGGLGTVEWDDVLSNTLGAALGMWWTATLTGMATKAA